MTPWVWGSARVFLRGPVACKAFREAQTAFALLPGRAASSRPTSVAPAAARSRSPPRSFARPPRLSS
eukprot:1754397-Pyramimonas_sp.AAC.1